MLLLSVDIVSVVIVRAAAECICQRIRESELQMRPMSTLRDEKPPAIRRNQKQSATMRCVSGPAAGQGGPASCALISRNSSVSIAASHPAGVVVMGSIPC